MLTDDQMATYARDGFVAGVAAMTPEEVADWRRRIEDLERSFGAGAGGRDAERGWINVAGPSRLFDPQDLALYEEVLAHQTGTLAAGAVGTVGGYAAKEGTA